MATITQKIEGFSLENILQIFSLEKKSQTLRVHKEERTGLLDIDQGELAIVHQQHITQVQGAEVNALVMQHRQELAEALDQGLAHGRRTH